MVCVINQLPAIVTQTRATMSIRSTIIQEAAKIANEQGSCGSMPPLITDDLPLADSGLNSLSMAVLIIGWKNSLERIPLVIPMIRYFR